MSPVLLGLRMLFRISVTLRGRGMQEFGLVLLRDLQQVARSGRSDHEGLNTQAHVIVRTSRRGKIEDVVDALAIKRAANILFAELESWLRLQMFEIFERACAEIIDAQHLMPLAEDCIGQMGTKEAGCTGNQQAHRTNVLILDSFRHAITIMRL